jgi:hypothetical protein
MAPFFQSLRAAAAKRAQFNRTLAELRAMPLSTMIDLDIAPNDFHRLARAAVYG